MISFILPNRAEENIHKVISELELRFPDCQIIVSCDRESRGKGFATREAVEYATGEIIAFLDSDLDIAPRMAHRLIPFLYDYDIVVGVKKPNGRLSRKIITFLSRLYIKVLFNIPVDTQTGIKLFHRYALPDWKTNGFAFDIEVLAKAKLKGHTMCEVQVDAITSKKMPIKAIWKTLLESLRIKYDLIKMQALWKAV